MTEPKVESPFVEGTNIQYAWDSTSLGNLKTCARLYYYTMIKGYQPKEDSVHLVWGIWYHKAMQWYDMSLADGIKHEDAVFDIVRELLVSTVDWKFDHRTKTRESLIRAVIWKLDDRRDDPAKTYILQKENKPAVELSFKYPLDYGPAPGYEYVLCGHLDRMTNFTGDLYGNDYKSVWSLWNQTWEPDNQMTLYTFAANIIFHTAVKGMLVDMVTFKTLQGEVFPIFERAITQRTPDQLEEWLDDLKGWLQQAERYAKLDYWPMNDTSCGKYGGCKFREICSKSPSVREIFLEADFNKLPLEQRWNPLKPR